MLGGIGGILGGFGAGQDQPSRTEQQSGFRTLPKEIQDFMMQNLLPQIKTISGTPYKGVPMRGLNSEDFDPVFGSKARVDYTTQLMRGAGNQPAKSKAADPTTQSTVDSLRNEMLGRQYVDKNATYMHGNQKKFTKDDYAALGQAFGTQGVNAAYANARKGNGLDIDLSKLTPYVQAQLSHLVKRA